jgi:uncharacterized membrane protein
MMKGIRKAGFFIGLVLLLTLSLVIYNNTFNLHLHLLSNGKTITHAHPFEPLADNPLPFQNHPHNQDELVFYAKIFDLFNTYFLLTFLFIFVRHFLDISFNNLVGRSGSHAICSRIKPRAPPTFFSG